MTFEQIFNKYFEHVYNFVFKRVGTYQDAEDIASDTFMALWKTWDNVDPEKNVKALVFTIAHNKLNDHLRKKYRVGSKFTPLDDSYMRSIEDETEAINKSGKYRTILQDLVKQLKSRDQKFIELRYKQKMTVKQVAEELGITLSNAKVIQHRLIKKLQKIWESSN